MSEAFATWSWSLIATPAYAAIAMVGVTSLIIVLISTFKHVFEGKRNARGN